MKQCKSCSLYYDQLNGASLCHDCAEDQREVSSQAKGNNMSEDVIKGLQDQVAQTNAMLRSLQAPQMANNPAAHVQAAWNANPLDTTVQIARHAAKEAQLASEQANHEAMVDVAMEKSRRTHAEIWRDHEADIVIAMDSNFADQPAMKRNAAVWNNMATFVLGQKALESRRAGQSAEHDASDKAPDVISSRTYRDSGPETPSVRGMAAKEG